MISDDPTFSEAKAELLKCKRMRRLKCEWTEEAHQYLVDCGIVESEPSNLIMADLQRVETMVLSMLGVPAEFLEPNLRPTAAEAHCQHGHDRTGTVLACYQRVGA